VRGIDLAEAPLFRLHLFHLSDDDHRLVWTFPHILLDGGSFPGVVREVFTAYEALGRGEAPAPSGPGPTAITSPGWKRRSRGAPPRPAPSSAPPWPASAPRTRWRAICPPLSGGPAPVRRDRPAPGAAHTSRLQALAREHGLTLNTFVQAAWSLVLSDFTGDEDVVFGWCGPAAARRCPSPNR
jgi:hypothetical protein